MRRKSCGCSLAKRRSGRGRRRSSLAGFAGYRRRRSHLGELTTTSKVAIGVGVLAAIGAGIYIYKNRGPLVWP